tara:strand:- start:931 stop:1092 length:162 start_codon:yes stop_codon:yes gene_type:complete
MDLIKKYAGHLLLFAYTCEVINGDHLVAQALLLGWIVWKEWRCSSSGCCKTKK